MIVLGLLLVLVAAGAALFAVVASANNSAPIHMEGIGIAVSVTPLAMYVAGAVSVALLVLGFAMMSGGTRRWVSSRTELRHLRKEKAASASGRSTDGSGRTRRSDRSEETSKDNATNSDSGTT